MPAIVFLCTLCGALVAWNLADLVADVKARRAQRVAESNLAQAESMLKACFDHRVFPVGTAIYRCRAEKSELNTAHFPELGNRTAVEFFSREDS
jgi:uncharacterized membrane protein YccC